jgi:Rrf2 family nitric oxide-sensitive transcriptional repressor
MRLTTYTDYTLRVLIYLTLKYQGGEKTTIQEIAHSYGISRNHLMKIVHELSRHGVLETSRGRAGGVWLARPPEAVTVGEIVRLVEPDMAIVQCHEQGAERTCAAWRACNLTLGFRRALAAFMRELDEMTLADAVTMPRMASGLLGLDPQGRKVIALAPARASKRAAAAGRG